MLRSRVFSRHLAGEITAETPEDAEIFPQIFRSRLKVEELKGSKGVRVSSKQ
jgi:hypothetical protein